MDLETLNTMREIERYLDTFPFYEQLLFEGENCDFYVEAHIPGMKEPSVFIITPKKNSFLFEAPLAEEELNDVNPITIAQYVRMANAGLDNAILTLDPNGNVNFFQETNSGGGPISGKIIHAGLVSSMKNTAKFTSGLMEIALNHRDVKKALEDAEAVSKIVWAYAHKYRIDRSNLRQEQHDGESEDDKLLPF